MFSAELQSGKHSRINYSPFNRYSTYYFYHVLEFILSFQMLNLSNQNSMSFELFGLIRFFTVKWVPVNWIYSRSTVRAESECSQSTGNPCSHSVYSVRFQVVLIWLHISHQWLGGSIPPGDSSWYCKSQDSEHGPLEQQGHLENVAIFSRRKNSKQKNTDLKYAEVQFLIQ